MTLHPSLPDLHLVLAPAALIGRERGADGHAAGLRTTLLGSTAPALATGLSGMLLSLKGTAAGDVSTTDVMGLPLGILSDALRLPGFISVAVEMDEPST